MTQWHVRPIGEGFCIVNGTYKQDLDSFIQVLRDQDKQINERGRHYAYNNE